MQDIHAYWAAVGEPPARCAFCDGAHDEERCPVVDGYEAMRAAEELLSDGRALDTDTLRLDAVQDAMRYLRIAERLLRERIAERRNG